MKDKDDELLGHARALPPHVPDGEYLAVFVRAERGCFERRERLFLWFAIATPGPYVNFELYLSCPCPKLGGAFGLGSKLVAAYGIAAGGLPRRKDRITTKVFKNKVFRIQTRTVVKNAQGKVRAEADHYSVIESLLSVEAG